MGSLLNRNARWAAWENIETSRRVEEANQNPSAKMGGIEREVMAADDRRARCFISCPSLPPRRNYSVFALSLCVPSEESAKNKRMFFPSSLPRALPLMPTTP
jgi:hypothetical protein